jgi:hypothetical protein
MQIEGLPSVLLGAAMVAWLPASPLGFKQLWQEEQQLLHEQVNGPDLSRGTMRCVLLDCCEQFSQAL